MRDADYIYAVACIRAKEKTLLTDSDVQTMVGMKSEKEVLSYLVEKGWGDGSINSEMETVLSAEEEKQMKLLKTLGVDDRIIETPQNDIAYFGFLITSNDAIAHRLGKAVELCMP